MAGPLGAHQIAHVVGRQFGTRLERDERREPLAEVGIGHADDRYLTHRGMGDEQAFDLGGIDVLAAADDHVVVPAVDEIEPVGTMPHVPRGDHPVDELLGTPRRVALEDHLVAAEDPPRLSVGHLGTVGIEQPHHRAEGRRTGRVRVAPQVRRRRDADPRGLGGAIEVVEDVAVLIHEPRREATGIGRPGGRDDAQGRSAHRATRIRRQLLDHPLEHHGHGEHRLDPLPLQHLDDIAWVEAPPQDDGGAHPEGQLEGGIPPRVEDRGRDEDPIPDVQRDPVDHRHQGADPLGRAPGGPLRHPRRARGQDDRPTGRLRPVHRGPDRERIDRSGKSALRQCLRAVHQHIHDGSALLIVHQQVDLLLRQDQPQLLPRQPGVDEHEVDAERTRPDHHLDRADVIARHQADPVARLHPLRAQRDRSPHATVEELGIGRGPPRLVDHGDPLRCPQGGLAHLADQGHPPGRERCQLTDEAVRQVRCEHPAPSHGRRDDERVHEVLFAAVFLAGARFAAVFLAVVFLAAVLRAVRLTGPFARLSASNS